MAKRTKKETALTPEEKLQQALVPVNEQPYPVPVNWCWTTIGEINRYKSCSIDPAKVPEETFELYSVPSSADDYPEIVSGMEIGSTKQSVQKDDILLCKINPRINRVWKVAQHTENSLLASSEWIIIRNSHLNSDYLTHCFRAPYFRDYMLSNVSGVGGSLMRAQPKYVSGYPVPLPPLPEQQRIVACIESLFAKLDEVKEKAQAVVDGYEGRKAAILHKAFTGELTAKWRKEQGVNSNQWPNRKLKDCGEWMGGGTPSMSHPEYWENGNILWITSKDMKSDVIENTIMHVNPLGVSNSSANYNEKPSLLFVMRSGILKRTLPISMVYIPFTVNQDLKAVSPNDINLDYLFWACKNYEKQILNTCMKNGTTVESINAASLMAFEVPIASKDEQKVIVSTINAILKKETQVKDAAESVLNQINTMKKSILARAFRGELGTNDPSDEPAIELLKRVLQEQG